MFVARKRIVGGLALAVLWTTPAAAHVAHTVEPGETLWSIALANGMTPGGLAAANGISSETRVVAGTTVLIPPTTPAAPTTAPVASQAQGPPPSGAYSVQPGDTLSGIAARAGVSTSALAYMNGLQPTSGVIIGTVLKLPAGTAPGPVQGSTAPRVVPNATPNATPGRVTSGEIATIATQHGVSGSLAAAIAWQESGFNNAMVSSANARGVMQVMPGTWTWVEQNLAGRRLDPNSPHENVRAGVLYLGRLLRDSGGDPATAIAGYYQGGESVRRYGMLPETRRYVASVLALRPRFGG
jgi:LysM repeat protein